ERSLLTLKSNVGAFTVDGALKNDTVTVNTLSAVRLDTAALTHMFVPDSNDSNGSADSTVNEAASAATETGAQKELAAGNQKTNALIPKEVVLKKLHVDMLPAVYEPVHIHTLALDGKEMALDVPNLIIKKGEIALHGQTNMSKIEEHSTIKNNHLVGHVVLTPNQHLFDFYKLPIRKKAIGDIDVGFTVSPEQLTVDMHAKANHLLVVPKESNATDINVTDANATVPFNIDINDLTLHAVYMLQQKKADATLKVNVTTPFAKESTLDARFDMDGEVLAYDGMLKAGQLEGYDAKLLKPLSGLQVMFKGDEKQVETTIESAGLSGYFNVPDFTKEGVFHLETKAPVALKEMVTLPDALQAAKAGVVVDVPLNFEKLDPIKAKVRIRSNLANLDADVRYGKKATLDVLTTIPQNSLLKNLDKNIQWKAISPMKLHALLDEKQIAATLKSNSVSANMAMLPFDGTVEGKIKLNGMNVTLEGDKSGILILKSHVNSFKDLTRTIEGFYHMSVPPKIEGQLDLLAVLQKNGDMMLQVTSPQVRYQADRNTEHEINDVHLSVGISQDTLLLNAYHVNYNGMVFFATKPSRIDFKGETMYLSELWLNDQLKVTGELNTKTMRGEIRADASRFHFSHPMLDADAQVHMKTLFQGENTDITGNITLLEGEVHYDLNTQNFPSDSDIVIVQEMKEDTPSPFMDHLSIALRIDSRKPLVYKEGPADIKAKADIQIHKAIFSKPMILGSIDIVDGSSYMFQGKKFVLERSHIYLTGDPTKPMLDLTVKYKALRHLITINITGTPAVPNVLFSAVPSLTKEQILSIILFDSEEAAGTNNANDMMKMMGGAMAKSALNDLGVKIDHLVFGEGGSVEVGKKLTKNVTVIYINGEIPEVKVKYQYNPSLDIVIGASERSESIDAVYIKDFNLHQDKDDIVIKGR
ncbi:MAG: translocation/assembly module TamB, partial [Sulfurovum sp.]|nr:translocation/assembly module TamB [Sulfurovum sp.]